MPNNIFVIRHSNRMDKSEEERKKWFESKRFMENKHDSPLSKLGIENCKNIADNLMKHTDVTKIKYFYVSPLTRCIQTAIHVIDRIEEKTNHKILIRIEYGFIDALHVIMNIYYENGRMKEETIPMEWGGRKYTSIVDKELYPKKLEKKYGKYMDKKYNSIVNHKNTTAGTQVQQMKRAVDTFKKIMKQNTVVITHGGMCHAINQFIVNKKTPYQQLYDKFVGSKNVGVTSGCHIDGKNKKIIFKPSSKFMNHQSGKP